MANLLTVLACPLSLLGIYTLGQYGYQVGWIMLTFGFFLMLTAWIFSLPNID